jgi:hypothetical protein
MAVSQMTHTMCNVQEPKLLRNTSVISNQSFIVIVNN